MSLTNLGVVCYLCGGHEGLVLAQHVPVRLLASSCRCRGGPPPFLNLQRAQSRVSQKKYLSRIRVYIYSIDRIGRYLLNLDRVKTHRRGCKVGTKSKQDKS